MGLPFSRIAATTSLMLIPSFTQVLSHPYRSLAIIFVLWKILLLLIAGLSPGLGYDTSTDLLFELNTANVDSRRYYLPQTVLKRLSARLVRWDAIYFISSAKHGYIYEQEWAFGWGVTTIIGRVAYYCTTSKARSSNDIA
jgi:phosphatidylinositol glycan class V